MDNFQLLRRFYNRCAPTESLKPDDERYVDLGDQGVRGNEMPRRSLLRSITLSEKPISQLFTGFSGSGKSTELLLLQKELEGLGYAVILQDSEEMIDPNQPLSVIDLLLTIGSMADTALTEVLSESKAEELLKKGFWERTKGLLKSKVDLESVGLTLMKGVQFKGKLRSEPDFRNMVHEYLGHDLYQLYKQCVAYLDEVLIHLKEAGKEGLVLLIDSLEKMSGLAGNTKVVTESLQETFFGKSHLLCDLPCNVVYTVPPSLHILEPSLSTRYGNNLKILPMCKVRDRYEHKASEGIALMLQLLEKRMDLERFFGEEAEVKAEKLILASGGYPRALLNLIRSIITLNVNDELPVSDMLIDQAITRFNSDYQNAVLETDRRWLAQIAVSKDHNLCDDDHRERLARLFKSHVVMCYINGSSWYDVHPAIRDSKWFDELVGEIKEEQKALHP